MPKRVKVLQVASSDITVSRLLLPLIDRLRSQGLDVSAACADGRFARKLRESGYVVHAMPMTRSLSPWKNLRAAWALYHLIRRERFDIVHVHTPVAAGVARVAATLARTPVVIYTAHGFYFHDRMAPWAVWLTTFAERVLGHMTDFLFTQSAEDAQTAINRGISPPHQVMWISNGVDLDRFSPVHSNQAERQAFGIAEGERVVGFVGRLVREKGIIELLEGMRLAAKRSPRLVLLVAGDNKAAGDRDQRTEGLVRRYVGESGLPFRVVFTGFIDNVEDMMRAADVHVLPSYREGMPRSVIEAMAVGKPVIATNIRGCREEVVDGETGHLIPVGNPTAIADALVKILSDRQLAREMGVRGRERAESHFDERDVLDRQIAVYGRLIREKLPHAEPLVAPVPYRQSRA